MDPLWQKVAEQVPNLGALIWMVVYFLKHIRETADRLSAHDEKNATVLAQHQEKTAAILADVIERNTTSSDRNTEIIGRAVYVIEKHDARLQKVNGRAQP